MSAGQPLPRILVVEDNPVNRELLLALLETEGCTVQAVGTADEGLGLARTGQPDLILMDIQLPGMTGYEATRLLKADPATAPIPVVAVTAQAMQGEEARAHAAGRDGYLAKPLDAQTFWAVLRRFLPGRPIGSTVGDEDGS